MHDVTRPTRMNPALRLVLTLVLALALAASGTSLPFLGGTGSLSAQDTDDENGALTLEPTRTIAFTTTEGTYMDLDVSPDGSTIVFGLVGDIYTVPIAGGDATRLTSGMPYDVQPTFSPDGSEIAFISDKSGSDNIWVMNADGSDQRAMTTEKEDAVSTPEWSPDGEYVAARRARELWLYHRNGGSGMKLSSDPLVGGVAGPKFSADGRYVFFSSRQGGFGGGGGISGFTGWQIRRLDRTTGDVATITASPNGAYRPALSPDGQWLVYGARLDAKTGLRARNLETDREHWLLYDIDRDSAERAGMLDLMPRFTFTPDSRDVVIATGGTFHRVSVEDGSDRVIAFSADIEQQLAPLVLFDFPYDEGPVQVKNLRYANRDPGGERLVFSALGKIWLQEQGGSPEPILGAGPGQFQPVFSPDGNRIVYVTWDDVEGGHVWTLPLRGTTPGEPVRLTEHAGYYQHPAWSPDGNRIAFIKEDAAAFRNIWSRNTGILVWIDADGGALNEVTSAPSDNRLTFSPDGERISYVANITPGGQNGTTKSELVSVRLDGTDKRTLAEINAETYEAVPSPDGRWVAFGVREDIYLAALPLTGEVPSIGEARGPGPVKRVTREGGVDIHWEDGSGAIAWTFGDTYHHITVDSVFAESGAADPSDDETDETDEAEDDAEADTPRGPQPTTIQVQLSAARHHPTGTVALVGADVITMENEQVLEDATVVVTDNRIVAVGPGSSVDIPSDATVIDVAGKFIMPGMIDMHAHLRQPREVFAENTWSYLANLAYGVTTAREVSSSNDSYAYKEMIESGAVLGPRLYSTGRAMTTTNAKIENLEDARSLVRHYKNLGATVIKQYMQPHRRQRQWVIQAAMEEGINATNEGGGDFRLNMTQMYDGYSGFEHSLPIADLYEDVIQLFARSKILYTPTLVVSYGGPTAEWYFYQTTEVHDDEKLARFTPHDDLDRRTRRGQLNRMEEYHFPAVARGAARILQAGGNVAMGAHGEQQGIGAHWELWGLQMGGLSNYDALRTVTTIGAEGLGMAGDLGTVTAGKLADLVVLDANPLDDIRNSNTVHMVMKNGELFDGDSLDMLWPERAPRPPLGFRVIAEPGGR